MERVLIAGGGTGGHLFPGLAVAQVLKSRYRGVEIVFVGTERGLENKIVPREGYELKLLPVRGLPRRPGRDQLRAILGFVRSLVIMWGYFRRWRPDVILGTGGYVSAPAVIVGRALHIPVVLQEQNAVPGMVNRMLSRIADQVHINFAGARRYFRRRDNLRLTGNPLRPGLLSGNRQQAFRRLGLSPERQTVLVLGGSHGATAINQAFVDAVDRLSPGLDAQFLIQTGQQDLGWVRQRLERVAFPAVVLPFIKNIDDAYTVARLIVCRAGAMTLSEVAACGIPAILVPYPHATNNHQLENAREMVDRGAAVLLPNDELSGARLAKEMESLLTDRPRLRRMATSAHGSARFGGAETLASAMHALATGESG